MSRARPGTRARAIVLACLALPLAGCLAAPDDERLARAEWGGTALVQPDPQTGTSVRLDGTGWARITLEAAAETTFHVHPMRETSAGRVDIDDLDGAMVAPGAFLSVTLFAIDGDHVMPMYDLLVWGFPRDLRNETGGGEDLIGFVNPGRVRLSPGAPGVLVVATDMEGVVIDVLADGADTTAESITVRPVAHPRLVAAYHADGVASHTGALGVVTVEDREAFPDTPVTGAGLDAVVVWQSGEGGARYGSMVEEMGHRMEDGTCSGRGFTEGLFIDEQDPTGSVPVLSIAATKGWREDAAPRTLCATALATMIGEWERTGAGAWFFHSPFEAPA